MRPIELELTAFGPFAGTEQVDFERLATQGLFVVCGPTGAGKSTLFDAMTFALYGTIPGERLEHIRSHHVDSKGPATSAALTFDAGGHRYRVERTAKHERPRVRGRGTTVEPPKATLYRLVDGRTEPVVNKPQEVNARCEQLVGLTAAQFQRVVLLPQGKWAEFLLADTRSRRELLQQLFGTQLYERATELAKEHAASLASVVADAERDIERHRTSAATHVAELESLLGVAAGDGVERHVDELRRRSDALATRATAVHDQHSAAATVALGWEKRALLTTRHAALESQRSDAQAAEQRHEAGTRAVAVVVAHRADEQAQAASELAASRLDEVVAGAAKALTAAGVWSGESDRDADPGLSAAPAVLADHRRTVVEQRAALDELARAHVAVRTAQEVLAAAAAAIAADADELALRAARRTAIETERREQSEVANTVGQCTAAVAAASRLLTLRTELDELITQALVVREAAEGAESALDDLTARFLADVAPELADRLSPGDPCPVCGSCEHPEPAKRHPTTSVTRDDLAAAKTKRDQASDRLIDVFGQLEAHRQQLGDDADTPPDSLREVLDAAKHQQRLAVDAEQAVQRLTLELRGIEKSVAVIEERGSRLQATHADAVATLAARRERERLLTAESGSLDATALGNRLDLLERADRTLRKVASLRSDATAASGAATQSLGQLRDAVRDSGFVDAETALAHTVDPRELEQLRNQITTWKREFDTTTTLLAELAEQRLPDERPDIEQLAAELAAARADADEHASRLSRVEIRSADAAGALAAAAEGEAAIAASRAAAEVAREVFEICNGNNTPRVQLETWVLAGQLDRVTAAANVHLARMTRSRYSLRRGVPTGVGARRSGLDLVADDAETGRPRPPTTLSGGEQFQASLALALGLADVVSQSGDLHEALFVDEGFGSLDADSLDDAVDALVGLHATGRLVGVITHVETMKRQLPVGIEVRRRPSGGSTITQPD